MIELFTNLLRFVAASFELGLAANGQLAFLLLGVVGAAAVVVVVLSVRALPALVAADPTGAATRLRQTADPWRLLSQSDPDAPGRARPRAPGLAVPTA
ncbi:DUF6412 domain-containing protein [Agromyces mediolanus]|uniref:DUF6412 domain-containing protein n=1 Tax=Agromyces mediolanus TaxID=41986 RepID=UPI003838C841